jgi:hypothetical protein
MISMGIFTSVLFLIGCIMTALPFLVSRWIAKRLQVSSAAYYVGCGLVTGLLFFSLHMALALNIPQDPGDPTWADLIVGLLCYAFSGVIGSFVYWRFAVARPSVPSDRK